MAKYCCLFNHFNPGNGMYDYVHAILDFFASMNCEIIVISNSPFDDDQLKVSIEKKYSCKVFERENVGLDFGAWQWAMKQNLIPEDTEHLFLANDSVFGPLYNIHPIIESMTTNPAIDFWGLSDSYEGKWHLQSYFICFTRKAFISKAFKSVFRQNFGLLGKKKIIELGEILLSQSLIKAGLRGKAFVSYDNFIEKAKGSHHNPTHFFWADLIQDFKFPFLKRDLIVQNPENFKNILDVFEVIEATSGYPTDHIIQVFAESRMIKKEKKEIKLKPMIICHIFFYDTALMFLDQLTVLNQYNSFFIFNISATLRASKQFVIILQKVFPGCIILSSPNQGRDIGGKFAALNIALKLNIKSDITLIIHDKKSEHLGNGEVWRDELFKIISQNQLLSIIEKFENKSEIGIICSAKFIQNEYSPETKNFLCTSNKQIKTLLDEYNIITEDYNFVAGNIFWIRTKFIEEFFKKRSLVSIRSALEKGNALDFGNGTFIHSWERIMSWIATSQGYKIYGI